MSERSNIRDVAARAGVAGKTVRRLLQRRPYVPAHTQARVEPDWIFAKQGSGMGFPHRRLKRVCRIRRTRLG